MKKWLEENKWSFEVSMSLRGICPEILQHPRKQVTSNEGERGGKKKRKENLRHPSSPLLFLAHTL